MRRRQTARNFIECISSVNEWCGMAMKIKLYSFYFAQTRNNVLASAAIVLLCCFYDLRFLPRTTANFPLRVCRFAFCLCLYLSHAIAIPRIQENRFPLVCLSTSFKRACAKTSISTKKSQGPSALTPLLTLSFRRRPFSFFLRSSPPGTKAE